MSDSCDPMDCSLPGFSAHRIFQARILEWVAVSFPRGSSQPTSPVLAGGFFVASFNMLCYRGQRERESVCVCVCGWGWVQRMKGRKGEGHGEHVGPETSSEETLVPSQTCHLKKTQHTTYTKQIRSPVSVSGFLASLELLTKEMT